MICKKIFLLSVLFVLPSLAIDVLPETEDLETVVSLDDEKRGMLSIPAAPNLTGPLAYAKLISPTDLGKTTSVFGCCKQFQLTRSITYVPLTEAGGSPMVHMTGKGATFDLGHNCASFNRSGSVSNCIGIEVGFSPNDLGSLTQTDSITIENGILCNWDIAILVHAGVRHVTLKNLILSNNTIPIVMIGETDNEITTVYLENVFIVGENTARLVDLKWIRAKLLDGTSQDSGPTAANPSGYTTTEVMLKECNPVADTINTAYVYTGMYCHAVANMQCKNVSVSNIGFDGDLGAGTAEVSVAYGMWFRNCTSLFLEDIEATKTRSAMTSVGVYFDMCTVVSIKQANTSNNFVADVQATGARSNCRAGRWAAAIVLKDINSFESCDVVLSNTQGIDRTWGVRTILNPVTRSDSFGFENIFADFLRGDEVIGFDLGDTLRNDASSAAVPPGAIRRLRMKNISISSARGLGAIDAETDVATFFKGIHLGDGSKDITLDDVRIESNNIAAGATGISSGIEFGGESTVGTGGANGTGKASGTIQNLLLTNVSISGNTGGGSGIGRFVGIRAQATGTTGGHTVDATNNLFEEIVLKQVRITNNQFNALRAIDDTGEATPITLKSCLFDTVSFSGTLSGNGIDAQVLEKIIIKNSLFADNTAISVGTVQGLDLEHVVIRGATKEDEAVIGLDITTAAKAVRLIDVKISDIEAIESVANNGLGAYGIRMRDVQDGIFKDVLVSHITASGTGTSVAPAYGIQFISSASSVPSVKNLTMENITVSHVSSVVHNAISCEMNGGIGIQARTIDFSGAITAAAATQLAIAWRLLCTTGQGFESVYVDGFRCNDQSGPLAYGIYVQDPGSMTAGVRTLQAAEFKNGTADNNISTAGVAYGIAVDRNATATQVGACDTVFDHISVSKNSAVDGDVVGLYVHQPESITLKNIKANTNNSTLSAGTGPFQTHGILLEESVDNLEMYDVIASGNIANNGNATGMQVDQATVVYADGIKANDNRSETTPTNNNVAEVRGIYFKASVGSEQSAGCVMNNLQACGNVHAYRAYGIHLQEPTGVSMHHIDASANKSDQTGQVNSKPVLSQAVGLMLEGGKDVHISDVHTCVNTQAETTAANLLSYVSSGPTNNAESVANDTNQISRNWPVAQRSGAYGIFAQGVQSLSIDGAIANANEGVRAFGVCVRDLVRDNIVDTAPITTPIVGNNPVLRAIQASDNYGIGAAINTVTGTNTAMAVPDNQAATIFGGVLTTETVDLVTAYTKYLEYLNKHQVSATEGSGVSNFCSDSSTVSSSTISNNSFITSLYTIIWATIAQFRRFSTSIGIGVYNCNNVTIEDCQCIGNKSDADGAAGIVLYGCGNKGHLVQNCVTGANQGWIDSARTNLNATDTTADINISEWLQLYTFIGITRYASEVTTPGPGNDNYTFAAITSPVTATHIALKPTELDQPDGVGDWRLNQRRLTVGYEDQPATDAEYLYDFATVAPVSAGIALEGQRDSKVLSNISYSNHGNAGLSFGIISDAASSTMFSDNKATANESDALGYTWGIADITFSTPNMWFKNWMYANRVDVFLNSSLLLTFNSDFSSGQSLPLKTIQPGSVDALAHLTPMDNIIVEFVNCRQIEDCLGDCVKTLLGPVAGGFAESLDVIGDKNTTPYPDCPTCV